MPKDGNCAFHLLHFWQPWVGAGDAAALRLLTAQKIEAQEVKLDADFFVKDAAIAPDAATPGSLHTLFLSLFISLSSLPVRGLVQLRLVA